MNHKHALSQNSSVFPDDENKSSFSHCSIRRKNRNRSPHFKRNFEKRQEQVSCPRFGAISQTDTIFKNRQFLGKPSFSVQKILIKIQTYHAQPLEKLTNVSKISCHSFVRNPFAQPNHVCCSMSARPADK